MVMFFLSSFINWKYFYKGKFPLIYHLATQAQF